MKCSIDGPRASAALWLQETLLVCWADFAPGNMCYADEKYVDITNFSFSSRPVD